MSKIKVKADLSSIDIAPQLRYATFSELKLIINQKCLEKETKSRDFAQQDCFVYITLNLIAVI